MRDVNAPLFVQHACSLCSWLKAVHTMHRYARSVNGPLAIRRVLERSLNVARTVCINLVLFCAV